ncbi:MAG: CHC2 zinc finger domain-containing protein [Bacteroidales bacterium]|nr:CHC2 zinc finger domain-containing protein [Bacteroidales bacterium]
MGKALEWLGADGCRAVAESLLTVTEHKGGEIWAHCPWHEESTPGGAFSYSPEKDVATCLSCSQSGDLIAIYCGLHGYPLDSSDGFREFRDLYAKDAAARTIPVAGGKKEPRVWAPKETTVAPPTWHEKAASFVGHSCTRLENNADVQAQLLAWGITMETARLCRMGWNDQDKAVPRGSWGLPEVINPETGKNKKIWLPQGLVMPMYSGGKLVKIKIRRPQEMTSWGVKLRYWEVPGGENNRFHTYGRPQWTVWVVVETERDAALVWQETKGLHVGAMGLGGATKRPTTEAAEILRRADVILVALDNDQAGVENCWKFWAAEFPQAIRWPVPPSMGKDVGDAVKDHGLDVVAWVRAGIPGHVLRRLDKEAARIRRASAPPVMPDLDGDNRFEDQSLPEPLRELLGILRQYPLQVDADTAQVLVDQLWVRTNKERWEVYRRASWLLEAEPVKKYLSACPGMRITTKTIDQGLAQYRGATDTPVTEGEPAGVQELFGLMSQGPLQLERDTLRLEYDQTWARKKAHWDMILRISNELVMDQDVVEWVGGHPDKTISAGNFWRKG